MGTVFKKRYGFFSYTILIVFLFFALIQISRSGEVESLKFQNNTFVARIKGDIRYKSALFKNPDRFVLDIINVDKCSLCREGHFTLSSGKSTTVKSIEGAMHTSRKPDLIYNLHKSQTLRLAFTLKTVPDINIKKTNDLLSVVFSKKIVKGKTKKIVSAVKKNSRNTNNLVEQISYRRFKTYEMLVVLTKTTPAYNLTQTKNMIHLSIKGTKATKTSLHKQYLSKLSYNIDSLSPVFENGVYNVDIELKNSKNLRRDYKDRRHVYLIFDTPLNLNMPLSGKSSLSANVYKKKTAARQYSGSKISFNVRDADVQDVLRVIAAVSGYNIITSDIKGKITMTLKDVPWDQALDLILQQKGLVMQKKGNIIMVTTASRMQSMVKNELRAIQDKQELEREKNAVTETIELSYITPDYAAKIINELLYRKKTKAGFIVSDIKNNALICHDTKENIDKIKNIAKTIDVKKKAVEIDARIVEISRTYERQLGIQWGGNYANFVGPNSHTYLGVGGASSSLTLNNPSGLTPVTPSSNFVSNNFVVNLPTTLGQAPTSSVSLAVGNVLANYNLDLKLTAGEINGYSKILSSPKIITLDNEAAKIKSGQEIPYQESAGASGATSVTFKTAALNMEVTPHITNNNQVILKIKVTKDSADYANKVNGEPPINTNEVDSTVILNNGQTIVLGGLLQKKKINNVSGVPGLMRIPFLGWLFKTKYVSNPQSELYIFVTPKILKDYNEIHHK